MDRKMFGVVIVITCITVFVVMNYSVSMHRTSQLPTGFQWTVPLPKCTDEKLKTNQKKFICTKTNKKLMKSYQLKVNITWNKQTLPLDITTEKWWSQLQWPYKYINPSLKSATDLMAKLIEEGFSTKSSLKKNTNGCRACAIVGNSQILRETCYGKLIDSHDYIFRFNDAPLLGYETHVGNKTTHRIAYPESCPLIIDKDVSLIFLAMKKADLIWLESATHSGKFNLLSYKSSFDKISVDKSKVNVVHPEFIRYVNRMWSGGKSSYPSSGMLGIVMALHVCDSVSLFGFGADKSGSWQHYYETFNKAMSTLTVDTHNRDHEEEMLEKLVISGMVVRYH